MSTITHKAPFEERFVKYGEEYELIKDYAERIICKINYNEAHRASWDCSPYGRLVDHVLMNLDYSLSKLHTLTEMLERFPKSGNRFSEKKRGENKELEPFVAAEAKQKRL